jgi:hypothetical protein
MSVDSSVAVAYAIAHKTNSDPISLAKDICMVVEAERSGDSPQMPSYAYRLTKAVGALLHSIGGV